MNNPSASESLSSVNVEPGRSGAGGGSIAIFLLMILAAGATVYYFAFYQPPVAPVSAKAGPADTVSGTSTPAARGPRYSEVQLRQYVQDGSNAFIAERSAKSHVFLAALNNLMSAGGFTAQGMTSHEAIAARKDLLTKALDANNDYLNFITNQEAAFTEELKKTPLNPSDVRAAAQDFSAKASTEAIVRLRTLEGDYLNTGGDMLNYLDSKFGNWTISGGTHFSFKKPADSSAYVALQQQYNAEATALQKMQAEVNAANGVTSAPASGAAASPGP